MGPRGRSLLQRDRAELVRRIFRWTKWWRFTGILHARYSQAQVNAEFMLAFHACVHHEA